MQIPYSEPFVGGNVKMVVTPAAGGSGGTNTVRATFYLHKSRGY